VSDQPTDQSRDAEQKRASDRDAGAGADPRFARRANLANRLFPGPSRQMSEKQSERVQELLTSFADNGQLDAWREAQKQKRARGRGSGPGLQAVGEGASATKPGTAEIAPTAAPAAHQPAATAEDVARVQETLDKQNELLQAILQSSVDTQTDARATAQNSRTFAWAGTAIALLTLVATIISIVAAVRAN
jgi:hypothetical protein